MIALIDGDLLVHEAGFAVQKEGFPGPFEDARSCLHGKIERILHGSGCDDHILFISGPDNFRYDVAVSRPYKGSRAEAARPFHLSNLKLYIQHAYPGEVVVSDGCEADDEIAMHATALGDMCVVCSRDKDLRQLEQSAYSWEMWNQPEYSAPASQPPGFMYHDDEDTLRWGGYLGFCTQWLVGDVADSIPGLPRCGPVRAYTLLKDCQTYQEAEGVVIDEYERRGYGEEYYTEQAKLVWMCRRILDGQFQLWSRGLYS